MKCHKDCGGRGLGLSALVKLLEAVLLSRQFCLSWELFASVECFSAALGTSVCCKEEFHGS